MYLFISILILVQDMTAADTQQRVVLSERSKFSYSVNIDQGNLVLNVPRNWSPQTQTEHRTQESWDGVDQDFRQLWEIDQKFSEIALLQEIVNEKGEFKHWQIWVMDSTAEFDKAEKAADGWLERYQGFAVEDTLFRKVMPLTINGRKFFEFRILTDQLQLERHVFVESNGTIYHIWAMTDVKHSHDPAIDRVLTRIKLGVGDGGR